MSPKFKCHRHPDKEAVAKIELVVNRLKKGAVIKKTILVYACQDCTHREGEAGRQVFDLND